MSRVLTLANTRFPAVESVPPWLKPAESPRQRSFCATGSHATRIFPRPSGPIAGGEGGGAAAGPLPAPGPPPGPPRPAAGGAPVAAGGSGKVAFPSSVYTSIRDGCGGAAGAVAAPRPAAAAVGSRPGAKPGPPAGGAPRPAPAAAPPRPPPRAAPV